VDISRRTSEAVVSGLCLASVITALVSIDSRVRDRFYAVFDQASREGLSPFLERLEELGRALVRTAEEHSLAQEPLLIFTAVALVLVLFMLRS
jgi:hypothetical protein